MQVSETEGGGDDQKNIQIFVSSFKDDLLVSLHSRSVAKMLSGRDKKSVFCPKDGHFLKHFGLIMV